MKSTETRFAQAIAHALTPSANDIYGASADRDAVDRQRFKELERLEGAIRLLNDQLAPWRFEIQRRQYKGAPRWVVVALLLPLE